MSVKINETIIDQIPMMKRTKEFIKRYGLKVVWVAGKLIFQIAVCPHG